MQPAQLTILNLFEQSNVQPNSKVVVGDACSPPWAALEAQYDLVYSNSVIGHVGGYEPRRRFADTVTALADHHWIQTPYRYFPIDPCFVFPVRQSLPLRLQAEVARRWRFGHRHAKDMREEVAAALSVELLSRTELRHYFPSSDIWSERFLGLAKSIVAVV